MTAGLFEVFTVFICTHNRATFLNRCLEALVETASEPARIVVVDNGSRDATRQTVERFGSKIEYVYEENIGLSHARNRALAMCQTKYLVFLDDDGVPEASWFTAVKEIAGGPDVDVFGGPYTPFYTEKRPEWFDDSFGSAHLELPDGLQVKPTCLSGGNMGWRKDVLESVGGFRSDLGLVGQRLRLGEETAVQKLLHRKLPGLRVYFSTKMRMKHHVCRQKMHVKYIAKRSFTYGWQLGDIDNRDPVYSVPFFELVRQTKLGLPLIMRLAIRDRVRYPYWRSYAAQYLSLNAIYWGILARRLSFRRPASFL